jgi:Zn-dependent protease
MNPYNFRHPARDRMISAAAGPISNIIMMLGWGALGAMAPLLFAGNPPDLFLVVCYLGVQINGFLAAFNLLPIYPLDGHHILSYLIPPLRPIIDNSIWQVVFLALVLVPTLWQNTLQPILTKVSNVLFAMQYFVTGWGM